MCTLLISPHQCLYSDSEGAADPDSPKAAAAQRGRGGRGRGRRGAANSSAITQRGKGRSSSGRGGSGRGGTGRGRRGRGGSGRRGSGRGAKRSSVVARLDDFSSDDSGDAEAEGLEDDERGLQKAARADADFAAAMAGNNSAAALELAVAGV